MLADEDMRQEVNQFVERLLLQIADGFDAMADTKWTGYEIADHLRTIAAKNPDRGPR